MQNIKRELYLSRIRPYYEKQLIKTLTGQRRVGKSFVMKQVADEIRELYPDRNIIYIDKEQFRFDHIADYRELYTYIKSCEKPGANFLFIDEVQEIKEFEKALRSLLNEGNFDIYCTGSNSSLFSGELATLLSGRQVIIPVYSLSFNEFKEFHNLPHDDETLQLFIKYGGMPYLMHLPKEDHLIYEYLQNINTTVLYRDILARYEVRDVGFLNNLIAYLADNVGSLTVAKRISDYLKAQGTSKTVSVILNYLSYLQEANLVLFAPRYDIHGKRIFEHGGKYYFQDQGLRNAIAGYKPNDPGKLLENIIYRHLLTMGYKVYVGALGSLEIDFIAEKQNEKIYIQAALTINDEKIAEREFGNLLKIPDQFPKFVITTDAVAFTGTYKGIQHLSLLDFLLMEDFNSL